MRRAQDRRGRLEQLALLAQPVPQGAMDHQELKDCQARKERKDRKVDLARRDRKEFRDRKVHRELGW
jgi:hypothetical protein